MPKTNTIYEHNGTQYQLFSRGGKSQWGRRSKKKSGKFSAWVAIQNKATIATLNKGLVPGATYAKLKEK